MTYQFEDFTLDAAGRRLFAGSTEISLEPKVYALLSLLVRHHKRAVTRREIRRALWPNVRVGDSSLGRLVKELRRALDDDGRSQSLIRTIRGVGFQFVATVERTGDLDAVDLARETLMDSIAQLIGGSDKPIRQLLEEIREVETLCRAELDRPIESERGHG